ncbi:DNRLRE domain-containing protein [Sphaerisporangium sp. NPDC051017]|uniref:DNRLRE domain-containing protein n=1 Tax=Sphaerisporangium sp. NPDC051017 TaxID=3154636 RepID=UPI00341E249F
MSSWPTRPTAYPVTVDPSVVLPLNGDTDVNSVFDGNNVTGEYLKAGTEADGEKARAYLRFNTQGLKTPTSAVLKLTNLDAPSCGTNVGAGIQVRRVTGFWAADQQTWTPQPTNTTEDAVTSTEGSQLGFCGSGTMTWNITPIVAKWAAGTPNHGLVLQSPTETASANHRIFASAENIDGLEPPALEITSDEIITPGEGYDPADPGPEPYKPGRVEPETGVWITDAIDLADDGLITTRSHSAGQRVDATQPNEAVLGPNWRFEPLGGRLGDRLQDYSANGYLQIKQSSGVSSDRFLVDPADPNKFVAPDGAGTIVRNANGTFTHTHVLTSTDETTGQPISTDLIDVWTKVGATYLITADGSSENGMTAITYDSAGRFATLATPMTAGTDCRVLNVATCSVAQFAYAATTTATTTALGDIAGQLKSVTYDAVGTPAPVVAASYAYDNTKKLRQITDARQVDGEPVKTTTYTYDATGNITALSSPEAGQWTLTYASAGKLTGYTQVVTPLAIPSPSKCPYMSQFLWGQNGCVVPDGVPMMYGKAKLPVVSVRTVGGKWVKGVINDHCTSPVGSYPSNFNFVRACDMHDYGYGIIYYSKTDSYWVKSKKYAADAVFYTTLRDYVCNAYSDKPIPRVTWTLRSHCKDWAHSYYLAVYYRGGLEM